MQSEQPLLQIRRAREGVSDLLRGMILTGALRGDERLEEIALSQRIGVSRTPLREALITLEEEGWVRSTPNKGFSVRAADAGAVREIYPILGALEAAAIQGSGEALIAAAPRLCEINRKLSTETQKERQHELDSAFHATLVRDCGNPRLLKLIRDHWGLARRFDGAHSRGTADREGSCREHEEIIAAIEGKDFAGAAVALTRHWARGVETVVRWLASAPSP
jgi:DNA-binding GntR family transcriptional regulator